MKNLTQFLLATIIICLIFIGGYCTGYKTNGNENKSKFIADSTKYAKIIELQKVQIYDQHIYFKKLTDSISAAKLEYNASIFYKKPSK